jgi:methionyl-tRNA formyltransferase
MRFAWVGFHTEGIPALDALLAAGAPIEAVITLTPELAAKRSSSSDYRPTCERFGVPLHFVPDINGPAAQAILRALAPDVAFVIGWHQIVRSETLRLARLGMIGAHASLLPHNRGSAPINWAIIRGESRTGNTLFWLADEVDAGDIIDQTAFPITPYDTCATLYEQVARSNRDMLLRVVPRLLAGERPGKPQPRTDEMVLRRRRPADGLIDWNAPNHAVYDFVRALTRPYPGAFGVIDGTYWYVWNAALPPGFAAGTPGEILGPVFSPLDEACGLLVSCGTGAIVVLEMESTESGVLRGRALSDGPWNGRHWDNESARSRDREPSRR